MAVTRNEFDALAARVAALEGKKPPTTPAAVQLSTPLVTITGTQYTVEGVVTSTKSLSLAYLQIAVRGPGAKDLALTPGAKLNAGTSKSLRGIATSSGGDYTAYLAYSVDGITWVDGPKAHFTVHVDTPTPAPLPNRRVGKFSRLPFNSLVFRQTAPEAEQFGQRRGVPMDGLLMFKGRATWNDFRWDPAGHRAYLEQGRIVVTSMPHAPESEGAAMNIRGAEDKYKNEQRDLGKWLADNGYNSPNHYVRVDWECNGDWYHWSANREGGAEALRQAIANYVTNLRAGGATKIKFDLCLNKGPSQSGADYAIFPGRQYIDNIGIDQYDMWRPSYNQADWDREMAKGPSVRTNAQFAREQDMTWSWDEGGNTHGNQGGDVYGGDNPTYWELARAEIDRNIENLAFHVTYDDKGAPDTLAHDFAQNPKSWPVYKRLWTPT